MPDGDLPGEDVELLRHFGVEVNLAAGLGDEHREIANTSAQVGGAAQGL